MNTRCMQSSAIEHYTKSPYPAEVYSRRILLTQQAKNCVTKIEPFNRTASIQLVCGAGEIYNSGSSVLWRRDRERENEHVTSKTQCQLYCVPRRVDTNGFYTPTNLIGGECTRGERERERDREKKSAKLTHKHATQLDLVIACVCLCVKQSGSRVVNGIFAGRVFDVRCV